MPQKVKIVEVGPRDGLQNEKKIVSLADKIQFITLLSQAGFQEIEAGAFVSPKWVPQMSDTRGVFENLDLSSGIAYTALVPNEKGMEAALQAGVKKIAVFTAASETFNQKNINASIAESIQRFEPVVKMARSHQVEVRGYVSTAFVCPYEGEIQASTVADVVQKLADLGIQDISIGDTIGKATTEQVQTLLSLLLKKHAPGMLAMHFHDTFGLALQNV
jgi:hydroxymethylglutaryl-CoA lyase